MSEPQNQMEALIRSIKARGKVYFSHTKIDNKALDDVQTVFDAEVKELEEENKRLLVLLEKCWHDFTEIEHVAGIAPNKELYNAIWKEIK